jgi:hypothetical protein
MIDKDIIEEAGDNLDILLIFVSFQFTASYGISQSGLKAALFSAVMTTFVVETSGSLDTDFSEVTSNLLVEMIALQRAGDNATLRAAVPAAEVTTSPSTSDVWVNGLWFTSLVLSLSTALLAVLAKQWLRQYTSIVTGSARDRAYIRHSRWEGFEAWKVQTIIGLLPTILHASLGLFFLGLVIFLFPRHTIIAAINLSLAAILLTLYVFSTLLPTIYLKCPYRTQFSTLLDWLLAYIWWQMPSRLLCTLRRINVFPCLEWTLQKLYFAAMDRAAEKNTTFKDQERAFAFTIDETPKRALDLLSWLTQNTANSSAKRVTFQALGVCDIYPFGQDLSYANAEIFRNSMDCRTHVFNMIQNISSGSEHSQQDITSLQRWLSMLICTCSAVGCNGLDIVVPGMELGILVQPACSNFKSLSVSTPFGAIVLFQHNTWNHDNLLQHYDESNPISLPYHTWLCAYERIDSLLRYAVYQCDYQFYWGAIFNEVSANLEEYMTPLEYPETYHKPISLARFYAPILANMGWFRLGTTGKKYLKWAFPEVCPSVPKAGNRHQDIKSWRAIAAAFKREFKQICEGQNVTMHEEENPVSFNLIGIRHTAVPRASLQFHSDKPRMPSEENVDIDQSSTPLWDPNRSFSICSATYEPESTIYPTSRSDKYTDTVDHRSTEEGHRETRSEYASDSQLESTSGITKDFDLETLPKNDASVNVTTGDNSLGNILTRHASEDVSGNGETRQNREIDWNYAI